MHGTRIAAVTLATLVTLGIGGCSKPHHESENTTDSGLTGDEGEIKGVLTEVGGPAGSSPQTLQGNVDVYTLGGGHVGNSTSVSAWNFAGGSCKPRRSQRASTLS